MTPFLKCIAIGIVLLPAAELAAFIAVAVQIGFLATLALTLAGSLAGVVLLKAVGRGKLARLRVALSDGQIGAAGIAGASPFVVLAGILLVVPGLITDIVALVLLMPPVQGLLRAALGRVLRKPQAHDGVIDLDRGEWRRVDGQDRDR
jgi:UPF0716 protein FxsA